MHMSTKKYLSVVFFITLATAAFSQSSKESGKEENAPLEDSPYFPQKNYHPEHEKTKKLRGITVSYEAEKNYRKQKAEIAKQKRIAERELMKPQNTNPLFFGHRHKPKKHKPGKMKYCKVCGIRH